MNENELKNLYELISRHNERVNITAIKSYEDFLIKHIADSRLGERYIEGKDILDIGSGAGFPGLVFALDNAEYDVTMTDSVGKKTAVINDIIENMGIKNARALHLRIEDYNRKEAFDTVTARAVAPLNILAEYALPFVKIKGIFVAYKSINSNEEIKEAEKAVRVLGGKIEKIEDVALDAEIKRRFVLIRKIKPCDTIYPRGKNLPRTKPL